MVAFLGVLLYSGGSYWGPKWHLPKNAFVSATWLMILGGTFFCLVGVASGEVGDPSWSRFSAESVLSYGYVIFFSSIIGFSAYTWLIQNGPISLVATNAFVQPVIAITLGWLILSESVTWLTLIGAVVIISAVVLTVRTEAVRPPPAPSEVEEVAAPAEAATRK
jgi:drug/metabolite transporter (DMT)-like permease